MIISPSSTLDDVGVHCSVAQSTAEDGCYAIDTHVEVHRYGRGWPAFTSIANWLINSPQSRILIQPERLSLSDHDALRRVSNTPLVQNISAAIKDDARTDTREVADSFAANTMRGLAVSFDAPPAYGVSLDRLLPASGGELPTLPARIVTFASGQLREHPSVLGRVDEHLTKFSNKRSQQVSSGITDGITADVVWYGEDFPWADKAPNVDNVSSDSTHVSKYECVDACIFRCTHNRLHSLPALLGFA